MLKIYPKPDRKSYQIYFDLVLRARCCVFLFCRVKRGGSVGFVLTEKETTENENRSPRLSRKETGNSSKYSFSTEYSYVFYDDLIVIKLLQGE